MITRLLFLLWVHRKVVPRHGLVLAIFALANAAYRAPRESFVDWLDSASKQPGLLGGALHLEEPAGAILSLQLANFDGSIQLGSQLIDAVHAPPSDAMRIIAIALLQISPPPWLVFAVSETNVVREYIPTRDLESLLWLEPALDEVLVQGAAHEPDDAARFDRTAMGVAAERIVIAALARAGISAVHVAQLSASFGYDVETTTNPVSRIEVKGCGPGGGGRFHLSRNEFEASQRFCDGWKLVQVVFNASAFSASEIRREHIFCFHEFSASQVAAAIPRDTDSFRWEESATVSIQTMDGGASHLNPDPSFSTAGFSVGG